MRIEQYPLFDDLAVISDSHWSALTPYTRQPRRIRILYRKMKLHAFRTIIFDRQVVQSKQLAQVLQNHTLYKNQKSPRTALLERIMECNRTTI